MALTLSEEQELAGLEAEYAASQEVAGLTPQEQVEFDKLEAEYKFYQDQELTDQEVDQIGRIAKAEMPSRTERIFNNITGKARSAVLGMNAASPFGIAEKAYAGINSIINDESYDKSLVDVQQQFSDAQEANPMTYGGGEIAGEITNGVIAGGALKGVSQLGNMAATKTGRALNYVGKGLVNPTGLRQGAVGGVAQGVIDSTNADSLKEAAVDVALGGVGGGIGTKAVDLIGTGVKQLPDAVDLVSKKIFPTTGHRMGGMAKDLENQALKLPFVGNQIRKANNRSLADYHRYELQQAAGDLVDVNTLSRIDSGSQAELLDRLTDLRRASRTTEMDTRIDLARDRVRSVYTKYNDQSYNIMDPDKVLPADRVRAEVPALNYKPGQKSARGEELKRTLGNPDEALPDFMGSSPILKEEALKTSIQAGDVLPAQYMNKGDAGVVDMVTGAAAIARPIETALTLGTGTLAYTPGGQKALNGLLFERPEALKAATRKYGAIPKKISQEADSILDYESPEDRKYREKYNNKYGK